MNLNRLAEIKAWLEHIDPAYKNHDVVVDARDFITALETAQERIKQLEAEVVRFQILLDAHKKVGRAKTLLNMMPNQVNEDVYNSAVAQLIKLERGA